MAVYVDELQVTSPTHQWPFSRACHMTADTHDELMTMARGLRLKFSWLQHEGLITEHFDLSAGKREKAIRLGAVQQTRREASRRIVKARDAAQT